MLVLSRTVGEMVVVGENIVVKVLQVRGRRIRLGIEAPSATAISRPDARHATTTENSLVHLDIVESGEPSKKA